MCDLHQRGVLAMLESYCTPVSLLGLIERNPKSYKFFKDICLDAELYSLLEAIENHRKQIDDNNFLFVTKKENNPIVIMKKEFYTKEQCESICELASIDKKVIKDYKTVTPAQKK